MVPELSVNIQGQGHMNLLSFFPISKTAKALLLATTWQDKARLLELYNICFCYIPSDMYMICVWHRLLWLDKD